MKYISKENKIFVAGHKGMVGSAIYRNLKNNGYLNLLTAQRSELDLTDASSVKKWFLINKPDFSPLINDRLLDPRIWKL